MKYSCHVNVSKRASTHPNKICSKKQRKLTHPLVKLPIRKLSVLHSHKQRVKHRLAYSAAANGLMDPVDVRRDACADVLSTIVEVKRVDTNNSPCVSLIFTCQWTSTVTLRHNSFTSHLRSWTQFF